MQGKTRKGHTYYACVYAAAYGPEAALEAHGGQQIAEIDRKIKAQVIALEDGVEPVLVSERIAELRADKEALAEALAEVGPEREEAEDEGLARQLARVPDLTKSLARATPEVQRQVFEAFDLQIACDKVGRRIEIAVTVSEAVADAFENTKALRKEALWWSQET